MGIEDLGCSECRQKARENQPDMPVIQIIGKYIAGTAFICSVCQKWRVVTCDTEGVVNVFV